MGQLKAYARVSTDRQDHALQLEALTAYGVDREDIVCEFVSARKRKREQFDALVGQLNRGDTLVVWKFDRAARSMQGLINLACDLDRRGIRFVSLSEKLDTADPMIGKLSIAIFGWLAEMESNNTSVRVSAGIKAAKLRGTYKNLPGMKGATKKRRLTDAELQKLCVRITTGEITQVAAAKMLKVHPSTIMRYVHWYLRTCGEAVVPPKYRTLARLQRTMLTAALRFDPTAAQAISPAVLRGERA